MFGDVIALSFWLNGTASASCCQFVEGPYLESHYFGEVVGMALRLKDGTLKAAIDYAMLGLWERGVYADLTRRWFPINPYGAGP